MNYNNVITRKTIMLIAVSIIKAAITNRHNKNASKKWNRKQRKPREILIINQPVSSTHSLLEINKTTSKKWQQQSEKSRKALISNFYINQQRCGITYRYGGSLYRWYSIVLSSSSSTFALFFLSLYLCFVPTFDRWTITGPWNATKQIRDNNNPVSFSAGENVFCDFCFKLPRFVQLGKETRNVAQCNWTHLLWSFQVW